MPRPIRTLTVTVTAIVFLRAAAAAGSPAARAGSLPPTPLRPVYAAAYQGIAQAARGGHLPLPASREWEETASPAAAPSHAPAAAPAGQEREQAEPASEPDDDEEVSPGENPASCDGCELAGFSWAGTLWGLFGVSRRRRRPSAVIRGLQPR